jgi:hypothetical protein
VKKYVVKASFSRPATLPAYSNFGHAAIGVFEPLNDDKPTVQIHLPIGM